MRRHISPAVIASGVAALIILAGCSSTSPEGETSTTTFETPAEEETTAVAAGCEAYADYMGNESASVSFFRSSLPLEQDLFEKSWTEFESCTGIDIVYEGTDQLEAELPSRIQVGNEPDIALIPGPILLAKLVAGGGPVPAPAGTVANVEAHWSPAWKSYGTVDGTFYAAPLGSDMKSLVWYSPKTFQANGYALPTTWDELWALSDQMVVDGVKPWCGGIKSDTTTGQEATAWLAQIMLRMFGGETYDQWVNHEIQFDSPEVTAAMDVLAGWMKYPEYVNGGFGDVQTIATTPSEDSGGPILTGECGMLQNASSYAKEWDRLKKGVTVAIDGDVFAFYLPAIDDVIAPQPVVGTGNFVLALSDRSEVAAVQRYLSSAEFATSRAALGGWVSANRSIPLDTYVEGSIEQMSAEYLIGLEGTFRFEASDLMPEAVGAGAARTEMTQWFSEDKPTAEVLRAINAAWPSS